jgi:hypothetical protein
MRRGRATIFAAAALGAVALVIGAATAQAAVVGAIVTQPFSADSGDACRMGQTRGKLGWHTDTRRVVEVNGVMVDRPVPGDADTRCGNDGRYSVVTFTGFSRGTVVTRGTQRVDNGQRDIRLGLVAERPIDLVLVQVCRPSTLPGPADVCGPAQRYPAPITVAS